MNNSEILGALQWRYATKQFDPNQKVTQADIDTITEALRLTPSSNGLQPWKFVIVQNDAIKQQLLEHSNQQQQVTTCSHIVVLCARTDMDDTFVDNFIDYNISQGADPERSEKQRISLKQRIHTMTEKNSLHAFVNNQVYIALGNLLTTCAILHIDACPMGGFSPEGYDQILDLASLDARAVVICPIGYRDASDAAAYKAKIRLPQDNMIHQFL